MAEACNLTSPEHARMPSFSLAKVAHALLPLVILGYILGWLMSAISAGWEISPLLVALDCIGILLALWRCRELA